MKPYEFFQNRLHRRNFVNPDYKGKKKKRRLWAVAAVSNQLSHFSYYEDCHRSIAIVTSFSENQHK